MNRPDMWIVQKQSETFGWIISDWYLSEAKAQEVADKYNVPTNVVKIEGEVDPQEVS